jgi:hypothetical protein
VLAFIASVNYERPPGFTFSANSELALQRSDSNTQRNIERLYHTVDIVRPESMKSLESEHGAIMLQHFVARFARNRRSPMINPKR